jgi:2,3-bisphosphoglycerate-independent phosphoglycerate mutase
MGHSENTEGQSRLIKAATGVQPKGPVVLLVMDGVGVGRNDEFDAVYLANTPNLDWLQEHAAYERIAAHGKAVGLPSDSDMGNSEVGHNTLGAGRILDQGATRINKALATGDIWEGCWSQLVAFLAQSKGTLHLIGLLSDGNVHSNMVHLESLISRASKESVSRLRLHALFDGRDVPDRSAEKYVALAEEMLSRAGESSHDYRIASGGGRMRITMDRYGADWAMVERGWQTQVLGNAPKFSNCLEALSALRQETPNLSDQYIPEFVIVDSAQEPIGQIHDGDAVISFNFRGDRAIELSHAFVDANFNEFDRIRYPKVFFAGMVLYDGDINMPPNRLVDPEPVEGTVSELLARAGVTQFACAETQKFGHVTYFWNGNRSEKFNEQLETYLQIDSDQVPFDQRPWMKSAETADAVCEATVGGTFEFIRANFAGGDMVGHTGQLIPTIVAVEAVDLAIGRILEAVRKTNGCLVVTSDHGNAEDMVLRQTDGTPLRGADGLPVFKTSHSLEKIPFAVADFGHRAVEIVAVANPGLANVAATLCALLGFLPPSEYEPSLVRIQSQ